MKKINTIPSIEIKKDLFHGGAKKKKKERLSIMPTITFSKLIAFDSKRER